jgi:hypothetical protein
VSKEKETQVKPLPRPWPEPSPERIESSTLSTTRVKRSQVVEARNKLNSEIERFDATIRFLEEHDEAPRIFKFLIEHGIAVPVEVPNGLVDPQSSTRISSAAPHST